MAQGDEYDIINAVVAGMRKRREESETEPAGFRLPKQVFEQLQEAATAYHVSKTDVVVQSLKTVLPHLVRRTDQQSLEAKGNMTCAYAALTDFDLSIQEELRLERRSW